MREYLGRYPEDYDVDVIGGSLPFRVENKTTGNVEFGTTIASCVHQDHIWERGFRQRMEERAERRAKNRGHMTEL